MIAVTLCPAGHTDAVEGIATDDGGTAWPSAHDFCMECEQPVEVLSVVAR